ncbi:hypothetical protein [Cyclobacterium marinum]|uniref:Lipoprotein n=1 Tax=Cyclobacterium marinum (strain ATCC 25205 / DSM 745 / LMG 13164 / NCIMB 1802) TaxID=880070 RepID=G0IZ83_CYCMS|nr:hypothetical protein [Cyclobacterium marinum]AEL23862.1 hypothetical protein Cycma_0077 [Cyclobacterium marinum DSM 745]
MKNLLFILTVSLLFFACAETVEPEASLMVRVKYDYENDTYPVSEAIPVYIYKGLRLSTGDFTYVGDGVVMDGDGIEIMATSSQSLSSGFVLFEGLEMDTYGVVLDLRESKLETSQRTAINLSTYDGKGEMDMTVDIWPYDPWDLFNY